MGTMLAILGVLFLALFILVPLMEKFGQKSDNQQLNKITRFIFPLVVLLAVLQAVNYFFFSGQ
ncbi:hypothetical protein QE250_08870 [Chromatiaceae bacterium AAb-1]|nr:hypothetical protein [Chromatiaceae bacterium AAb-1]